MAGAKVFSSKRDRVRTKLKVNNRSGRKRIYLHCTNRHLTAQLFDDAKGATILTVSTLTIGGKSDGKTRSSKEAAKQLADEFFKSIQKNNISPTDGFIFDRGDKVYHGKIAVFADELREKGMVL